MGRLAREKREQKREKHATYVVIYGQRVSWGCVRFTATMDSEYDVKTMDLMGVLPCVIIKYRTTRERRAILDAVQSAPVCLEAELGKNYKELESEMVKKIGKGQRR